MDSLAVKQCKRCKQVWPADALHFKSELRNTDGLTGVCLPCLRVEAVNRKHGRHTPMREFTDDGCAACTKCGEFKPQTLEFFATNKKCQGGLEPTCRSCRTTARRALEEKRREAGRSIVGEKVCFSCGGRKDAATGFPRSAKHADGVLNVCRDCDNAEKRRRRQPKFPKPSSGQKFCNGCGQYLPFSDFAKANGRPNGLQSRCRACCSAHARAVREAAPPRIKAPVLPGLKYCGKCGEQKPSNQAYFHANRLSPDGLAAVCKACHLMSSREWRARNPDKVRAYAATRRARAVHAGGVHTDKDIQRQFQSQKGLCYWCRSPLEMTGKQKFHADHLIPLTRGGSNGPENLVCACPACNTSRNNKLPHEWMGRLL